MKLSVVLVSIPLLFGLSALSSCDPFGTIVEPLPPLRATTAAARYTLIKETTETAQAKIIETRVASAVAATLTAHPTPNLEATVSIAVEATLTARAASTPSLTSPP